MGGRRRRHGRRARPHQRGRRSLRGGRRVPRPLRDRRARELPPFAGGAVGFFGYDLVRTVETTLGRAQPRPDRAARHGADDQRRPRRLRPPAPRGDGDRQRLRRGRGRIEAAYDARRRQRSPTSASSLRGAGPGRRRRRAASTPRSSSSSNMTREQFEANVARIVEYVHAGDAFQVVPSQRFSAESPVEAFSIYRGPAHGQPLALHVLPRLRRLRDRRRLARAAGQGHRRPGRDPPDRRHLPARAATRRRTASRPRRCSRTRRSAPST